MPKLIAAMLLLVSLSINVYAQVDGMAAGNAVGRVLFYVLLAVGVIFLLRKVLKKK